MIGGGAMGTRALGDAALRTLASEWGGPRPAGAGGRAAGRAPVPRDARTERPRR